MIWGYIVVAVVGWLAASAMAPKINQQRGRDDGTRTSKASTDAYIPKIYGSVGKHEGITVFKDTNDADDDSVKNDLLHIIICWGQAVQSIDMVYIDDIPINSPAFLWDPQDDVGDPESPRLAYVRNFPNGFTPGYSDPLLTAAGIDGNDKFQGKAVSYIRLEYNPERNVFRGEPQITADITGTATDNPAEHLQDYLTNAEYGKGLSASFLDTARFNAAIALCNTMVPQYEGATENRKLFTCNIALDTSKPVLENVNTLLQSMRALMPIIDGKLAPIIEQDEAPVSFELTEDVIVNLGNIRNSNKNDRYNRVIVKYTEPNANWTSQEVVYEQADWLTEDNGIVLEKSVDLPTCTNYYEAGAFARAIAQISREQLRLQIEANPIATVLEVGDIVNVTHTFPGWNQKPFRVEITEQLSDGNVILTLREHQPYLYDYYHTGDKPSIPDSSIIRSAPSAPINISQTPVFNDSAQVVIDWESSALRFDYTLTKYTDRGLQTETTQLITKGQTATNEALLNGLALGDYRFSVRSKAGAGQSSLYTDFDFILSEPPTSTDVPAVEVTPGRITITPPTPSRSTMVYECVYTLNSSLTLVGANPDPISSFTDLGAGLTFAITGIVNGAVYHIWYRLRSAEGYGEWVKQEVTAQATYTWKVYASDEAGTNISRTNTTLEYVGYAYNQLTALQDITNPSIYSWFPNRANNWLVGTGVPASGLGEVGDNYLDDSTGDIYKKTISGWGTPIGNISPSDGDQWLSGTTAPAGGTGSDGDWYINTVTYEIYQKVAGAWEPRGTIQGAPGNPGDPGEDSVYGFFVHNDGITAVKDKNGVWTPTPDTQQTSTYEFYRGNTKISWGSLSWEVNSATDTVNIYNALTSPNGEAVSLSLSPVGGESDSPTAIISHDASGVAIAVTFSATRHGEDGVPGQDGDDGTLFLTISGSAWNDATADAAIAAERPKRIYDNVTITNDTNFSETRFWDGSAWVKVNLSVDGNFVVNGQAIINNLAANSINAQKIDVTTFTANSITADKIDVTTIDISQANWGGTVSINDTGNAIKVSTTATGVMASSSTANWTSEFINTSSGDAVKATATFGRGIDATSSGSSGIAVYGYNTSSGIGGYFGSNTGKAIQCAGDLEVFNGGDITCTADVDILGTYRINGVDAFAGAVKVDQNNSGYLLVTRGSASTGAIIAHKQGSGHIQTFRADGVDKSWINFNTGALDTSSSIRHKTIIERDHDTLDRVCELGKKGAAKTIYKVGDGSVVITLIAEEVLTLFPEAVRFDAYGNVDALSYNEVYANLPTAIHQLNETVKALKARIEVLENVNS